MWLVAGPALAQEVVEQPTWSIGDWWEFANGNRLTVVAREKDEYVLVRTKRGVSANTGTSGVRVFAGIDGWARTHIDSNSKRTEFPRYEYVRFPLKAGKVWRFFNEGMSVEGWIKSFGYQCRIVGWEEIKIAGRTARALRIEIDNWHHKDSTDTIPSETFGQIAWYAPEAKRIVRFTSQYRGGPAWEITKWNVDAGIALGNQPDRPSEPASAPPPSAVASPGVPRPGSDQPPVAAGSSGDGDDKTSEGLGFSRRRVEPIRQRTDSSRASRREASYRRLR
jgi:hypothetical protein